jgi:periplasmic divalent cation tolerance protein
MAPTTDVVLVLTTAPDGACGETIGRALVEARLAACVNVYPAMTSFYRWRGAVERDTERQVVIKTTRSRLAAVLARVAELHPYELPELLIVDPSGGSDAYLAWVAESTA